MEMREELRWKKFQLWPSLLERFSNLVTTVEGSPDEQLFDCWTAYLAIVTFFGTFGDDCKKKDVLFV